MAITTYAELQTAVATWLARDDLTLRIPDFITLFEASMNRRLRVRQMEATSDLTPSSGAASLPSDYLQWRSATWLGATSVNLEYVKPEWLIAAYPGSESGTPNYFTIEGSTLKIRPIDTTDIRLAYYQKVPVLSDSNTTNWLLTAHPDLYLFGTLVEAQIFAGDADSAMSAVVWKQRRDEILAEIEALSNKTRGAGSIRPMGATP